MMIRAATNGWYFVCIDPPISVSSQPNKVGFLVCDGDPMMNQTLEDFRRKVRAMSSREFKAEEARPHNKFGEEIVQKEKQNRRRIRGLRWAIAAVIISLLSVVATVVMGIVK
jgi:hypothetical protein